ncbi:MAG: ABC transporter substrate-binding protein [Thermoanaerobaculia bacterium]
MSPSSVLNALRRVALGLALLIAVSATLLLSDLQHRQSAARASNAAKHKWKIYFVQFNDVIDVEDAASGVMEGLRESGLQDGRDFEVKTLNAQGDMATVSALVDAAVTGGAEMIITFSTPTLQAALRRAQNVPVVYNYVSSGLKAGAGKSNADHVPNVTGVSLLPANDEALTILKTYFPSIHRLGTLYCPAETNMVVAKNALDESARRLGYEVVYVAANTATDVPDAAAALMSRDIDAVLQIPGNLTASAFGSIGEAGRRAHIPIFAFQKSQAIGGAMVVVGRDYKDSGRHAAHLAARIMRGESPARIPLEDFQKTRLIVNLDAARGLNITLPPALVQSAKEVIGAPRGNR